MSSHILQSNAWRAVKESLGNTTYELENGQWFQTTKLPLGKTIGYFPRPWVNDISWGNLYETGKHVGCTNIVVEPADYTPIDIQTSSQNIVIEHGSYPTSNSIPTRKGAFVHLPLTSIIDLTQDHEEHFTTLNKKIRNYVRSAGRKNVTTHISQSSNDFEIFLELYSDTKGRHQFFGRSTEYLQKVWDIFQVHSDVEGYVAITEKENTPLVATFLFVHNGIVYYTYAGSHTAQQKLHASYKHVWEILGWAHEQKYQSFDFYGLDYALQQGFSAFKKKFGGQLVAYHQPIDVICQPIWYPIIKTGMALRKRFEFLKHIV